MPKKNILLLSLALSLVGIACATKKIDIGGTSFQTRITNSGLKHFEVGARQKQSRQSTAINAAGQQRQSREPRVNSERTRKALVALARAHIEKNNYCREDFWVMDVNVYGPRVSLRGECNEPASENDRRAFTDTIKQW